jgi:hypothetical protein
MSMMMKLHERVRTVFLFWDLRDSVVSLHGINEELPDRFGE